MNMQSISEAENETGNIQLSRTFEGSVNQETRRLKESRPNLQGQSRESNSSNVGSTT